MLFTDVLFCYCLSLRGGTPGWHCVGVLTHFALPCLPSGRGSLITCSIDCGSVGIFRPSWSSFGERQTVPSNHTAWSVCVCVIKSQGSIHHCLKPFPSQGTLLANCRSYFPLCFFGWLRSVCVSCCVLVLLCIVDATSVAICQAG